jgi:putative FmdB family regulatory protein
MPTYEYKREDGTTFEIIQKMSETPLIICPTTGQNVRRVVSGGGGVVYKGEGWYVTDYKNDDKKTKTDTPEKVSDKSKETESIGNESKPNEKKTSSEKK